MGIFSQIFRELFPTDIFMEVTALSFPRTLVCWKCLVLMQGAAPRSQMKDDI